MNTTPKLNRHYRILYRLTWAGEEHATGVFPTWSGAALAAVALPAVSYRIVPVLAPEPEEEEEEK